MTPQPRTANLIVCPFRAGAELAIADVGLAEKSQKGLRSLHEQLRSTEPAEARGIDQMRLHREEAVEAVVPQRGDSLSEFPVAIACLDDLPGCRDGILDLHVREMRTQQGVSVRERSNPTLHKVRGVPRDAQLRRGHRGNDVEAACRRIA